jgi:hypothetical protein
MVTSEGITKANAVMPKIPVKGKNYAMVPARVQAFRMMCPDGYIGTEIVDMHDGVVTMQATVKDETGKVLATGFAQEKETSSYINKTSYIENCETSAVGRALGMLGLGSDEQMASAEELCNAITQQTDQKPKSQIDEDAKFAAQAFATINKVYKSPEKLKSIAEHYGKEKVTDLSVDDLRDFMSSLEGKINSKKEEKEDE